MVDEQQQKQKQYRATTHPKCISLGEYWSMHTHLATMISVMATGDRRQRPHRRRHYRAKRQINRPNGTNTKQTNPAGGWTEIENCLYFLFNLIVYLVGFSCVWACFFHEWHEIGNTFNGIKPTCMQVYDGTRFDEWAKKLGMFRWDNRRDEKSSTRGYLVVGDVEASDQRMMTGPGRNELAGCRWNEFGFPSNQDVTVIGIELISEPKSNRQTD